MVVKVWVMVLLCPGGYVAVKIALLAFKDFFTTGIVFVCAVAEDVDSVIN
jgi:hypothetical protein